MTYSGSLTCQRSRDAEDKNKKVEYAKNFAVLNTIPAANNSTETGQKSRIRRRINLSSHPISVMSS